MTFGKNEYLLSFWEETAKFFLLGGGGSNWFSLIIYCIRISTPRRPWVLSPWEERAKYFLLRVQLSFSSIYCIWISIPLISRVLFDDNDDDDEADFFVCKFLRTHTEYSSFPSSEKKNRRTATKSGILSRLRFAKLGDRDKKVSPSSATATNFKMRGGR